MPSIRSVRTPRLRVALSSILAVLAAGCAIARTTPEPAREATRYAIVPLPRHLVARPGEFRLDGETRILLADTANASLRSLAELLAVPLRAVSGLPLRLGAATANEATPNAIVIRMDAPPRVSAEDESYRLVVNERGAALTASTTAGLFNGIATIEQLLPPAMAAGVRTTSPWSASATQQIALAAAAAPTQWTIPAVEIEDAPRFRYRGILLDVGRYYFPP
jgi:hexosaminidase